MPKTKIMIYAFLLFLLTSVAFAQTKEMKEHKVIKGDTLWYIANTELQNPFFWPKIWKENAWLKNPHKIYPKQIIKIPAYLVKKEKLKDNELKEDAASYVEPLENGLEEKIEKKQPLIDRVIIMSAGYIADEVPRGGKIGESPSEQFIYGEGDEVWVDFDRAVNVGEKFYVVKAAEIVKHPKTNVKIGYIISIGGIAEIVKAPETQTMAKISECFREIDKGEILIPYFEMNNPPAAEQFRRPNVTGMIIAARINQPYQSTFDIVYIDKGREDGVAAGDIFRTVADDAGNRLPNGIIQIINSRDHTATAIIKSSSPAISTGNKFVAFK